MGDTSVLGFPEMKPVKNLSKPNKIIYKAPTHLTGTSLIIFLGHMKLKNSHGYADKQVWDHYKDSMHENMGFWWSWSGVIKLQRPLIYNDSVRDMVKKQCQCVGF